MRIAALIGLAIHRHSHKLIAADLRTCTLAKQLERLPGQVSTTYIHFGDKQQALEEYPGYGVDPIHCYSADSTFSATSAATVLAEYDLIVLGSHSNTGFSSGMLGYRLAHELNRPVHSNIIACSDKGDTVQQFLPAGHRRTITLELPSVITVHHSLENRLTFSYSKQQVGTIIEHRDQRLDTQTSSADTWKLHPVNRLRTKLKLATPAASAADRLQQALSTTGTGHGAIYKAGADKAARAIWDILEQHKLIK